MVNEKSIQAVSKNRFGKHFIKPLYDSYCFTKIPDTVGKLLTGQAQNPLPADVVGKAWEQHDIVLLFVIDGFGWEFFNRFLSKYPFLQRFEREGVVNQITSEFPSTTAAHITTINTGLEVGQSGVYEWFYYEPLVDRMIAPLLFSYAGDHQLSTLNQTKIDPGRFYPQETVYQQFSKRGIKSYVVQDEGIAHSPYSECMFKGAKILPYVHLRNGLEKVVELCQSSLEQQTYIYLYFGDIDSMGHRHGIASNQFSDAVDYCWKMFEDGLFSKLQHCNKKVALCVTADHGMVPVDPKTTHYLNRIFPDIAQTFKRNKKGMPLVPAGSCRDFFLHIEKSKLESVKLQLEKEFTGIAEVHLTQELIDQGFFGAQPVSKLLKDRIGNLVILPYKNQSIWWFEKHHFEQHFYAAHGGLTPEEMQSIFLFQSIGK